MTSTHHSLAVRIGAKISEIILIALIFLLPIWSLPWSVNPLESNKQLILIVFSIIGAGALLISMLAAKELRSRRSFVNYLVVSFLVVTGVSTFVSGAGQNMLFGPEGSQYAGFLTTLAFGIFYFLFIDGARSLRTLRWLFGAFFLSAFLAELPVVLGIIIGIAQLLIPANMAENLKEIWETVQNILKAYFPGMASSVGSIFALAIFSAFHTVLVAAMLLTDRTSERSLLGEHNIRRVYRSFLWVSLIFSLLVLLAVDFGLAWIMLLVGVAVLIGYGIMRPSEYPDMTAHLLPLTLFVLAALFLLVPSPLALKGVEVSLPPPASLEIVQKTLVEAPFFGVGPGQFAEAYAKYRSPEMNNNIFWNVRFNSAHSAFLTQVATLGLSGAGVWLLLCLVALFGCSYRLIKAPLGDERRIGLMVLASFSSILVARFLYPSNMVLEFLFWYALALTAISAADLTVRRSFLGAPRLTLIFSLGFALLFVFGTSVIFISAEHYGADLALAQASKFAARGDLDKARYYFDVALKREPKNDTILRNVAHLEILRLGARANQVPKDDLERQKFTREITQGAERAVTAAVRAARLVPNNPANIAELAFVYQNVASFVSGARDGAEQTYLRAIEMEPQNPIYPTQLALLALTRYDELRANALSKDAVVAGNAKTEMAEILGRSEDRLNSAILKKGDYAPAHFALARVYDEQGRVREALSKLEAVLTIAPRDVGVYFQLGLLHYRAGNKEAAARDFENALSLAPKYANAAWYLATIYEEQGKIDQAVELVRRVGELDPKNPLVKARLEKLAKGRGERLRTGGLPEPLDAGVGAGGR